MTTLQILRAKIEAELDHEKATIGLFVEIRKTLERFEGLRNTRRLVTALRSRFPQATVCEGNHFSISIYGGDVSEAFPDYPSRFTFYMPRESVFTLASFDATNTCYGEAAIQRCADRVALLDGDHTLALLATHIDTHNHAYKVVNELTQPGRIGHQAYYIAARMLEGTEEYKRAKQ